MKFDLIVFPDGACSGNPGPTGWGAVFVDQHHGEITEQSGYGGWGTNNYAELNAIYQATFFVPALSKVLFVTDSKLAAGLSGYGWHTDKPILKAAARSIADQIWTRRLVAKFDVCKGHGDVAYNNRADELARLEVKKAKIALLQGLKLPY